MELEDILRKNAPLKNIHAGKRCFLVGNGPSLKSQDLKVLKDETTIVASSFFRHPDAKLINPAYWVMADPHFWQKPQECLVPALNPVLELGAAPKLFLPSGAFPFFAGFNRGPLIDLHFFHYDNSYQPDHDLGKQIDFSRPVPPFGQNVMIVCLMLALYLGCNPIYLIGCDHDFYAITEETYNSSTITHFYSQQKADRHTEVLTWAEWKRAMEIMDFQYRSLATYATSHGFSVFNATPASRLETFPRTDYQALFTGARAKEAGDPFQLSQAAQACMDAGDYGSALILLEEALRANLNRQPRGSGLEYLKSLCLARLGKPHEALLWARQDHLCNPDNHANSAPLVRRLESLLG